MSISLNLYKIKVSCMLVSESCRLVGIIYLKRIASLDILEGPHVLKNTYFYKRVY